MCFIDTTPQTVRTHCNLSERVVIDYYIVLVCAIVMSHCLSQAWLVSVFTCLGSAQTFLPPCSDWTQQSSPPKSINNRDSPDPIVIVPRGPLFYSRWLTRDNCRYLPILLERFDLLCNLLEVQR